MGLSLTENKMPTKCHQTSDVFLKQIAERHKRFCPSEPRRDTDRRGCQSIPNCFVTGHLSKGSGGETGSKAQGWKMEMTVRKGMWSFTTTPGGEERSRERVKEENQGVNCSDTTAVSQGAVYGTGSSRLGSSRVLSSPGLMPPGTALPALAQARASDTAFARMSLTHLPSSGPRTPLHVEARALKTPLAELALACEDDWREGSVPSSARSAAEVQSPAVPTAPFHSPGGDNGQGDAHSFRA